MKRYLTLLIFVVFLIPYNSFAMDRVGFTPATAGWKDSSGNTLPTDNGYYYYSGTIQSGWKTWSFNQSNFNYSNGYYDYFLINLYSYNNIDTIVTNDGDWYYDHGEVNALSVKAYEVRADGTMQVNCYPVGESGTGMRVNTMYCPILYGSTSINKIEVKFYNATGGNDLNYKIGLSGWIYYHYAGATAEDIANALNIGSITTAQQQTTNAINNMNNSINDSSGNTNQANQSAINNFNNDLATNNTISSLITMPITLYQKILNSVNGSCSSFSLGNLLGTNVTFSCINPASYLGSTLWSVIDVIISGLFVFSISKRFISIFDNFSSMSSTKDEVGD